jgi:hypothetical protein
MLLVQGKDSERRNEAVEAANVNCKQQARVSVVKERLIPLEERHVEAV